LNSTDFVEAIRRHVLDAAIEDTIANLKQPPGRRVPIPVRARSDWYKNLSQVDAQQVDSVIATAVHGAVFGLFAVLDGARTIDDEGGRFELAHVTHERTLLNDSRDIGLHDLLNVSSGQSKDSESI
jgi:hypothetical protein